jgi:hypothetical protein
MALHTILVEYRRDIFAERDDLCALVVEIKTKNAAANAMTINGLSPLFMLRNLLLSCESRNAARV